MVYNVLDTAEGGVKDTEKTIGEVGAAGILSENGGQVAAQTDTWVLNTYAFYDRCGGTVTS